MKRHLNKVIQNKKSKILVSIIMGSQSDWKTMQHAAKLLKELKVPFEKKIVSAHRTPKRLYEYATKAEARGIKVIIAGAGGAAHLPGMTASLTTVPVLGVPIETKSLTGLDSLLSIAQMPAGIPVGTLAIGKAGAINAALLAIQIISISNKSVLSTLKKWRKKLTTSVKTQPKK